MAQPMTNGVEKWRLGRRIELSRGEVAYDVFGEGPPVILVHGTPMRSYLWRNIVPTLTRSHSVYVYDLLGYGESEKAAGQDVSIAAQARLLRELVEAWRLEEPAIAGHDIGGGIVLRAHLIEGVPFSRLAVLDGNMLTSPRPSQPMASTWHVREYPRAYEAMPKHLFEAYFSAYLGETGSNLDDESFEAYLAPWQGEQGQRAFVRQAVQFEEEHTAEVEPLIGSINVPTLIVWGRKDGWLDPSLASRMQEEIAGSELNLIPEAGHFVMEDTPDEVARILLDFFSSEKAKNTP